MSDVLYLYGFVPPSSAPPPPSLHGVSGRGVEVMSLGSVAAAVSSVPARSFSPARLEERVRDLEWLSEQGALHERVVTWFVDHGQILPARLLTLYSGPEALAAMVADRADAISHHLESLRDLREWDLKVSCDAPALKAYLGELSEEVARLDAELARAAPGRRYLLERKRTRLAAEETARVAGRLAGELHRKLEHAARDSRRLAPPSRDRGDHSVVLSAAYLVSRPLEEEVRAMAEEERERLGVMGLEVRLTGPWAPYRFLGEEPGTGEQGGGGDGT